MVKTIATTRDGCIEDWTSQADECVATNACEVICGRFDLLNLFPSAGQFSLGRLHGSVFHVLRTLLRLGLNDKLFYIRLLMNYIIIFLMNSGQYKRGLKVVFESHLRNALD